MINVTLILYHRKRSDELSMAFEIFGDSIHQVLHHVNI